MYKCEVKDKEREIRGKIPLTATSGKIRIKRRSILNEYGVPVATCRTCFSSDCYVEWQIGYDVVVKDAEKLKLSTLENKRFIGANGKEKALYELSEYVYYLKQWGFISSDELISLANELRRISDGSLFDVCPELSIKRGNLTAKEINGVSFFATRVEYPLVIYNFKRYEIVAEIITREKQRAIGVQPMLYLCFPVTELQTEKPLIGRAAGRKEIADFIVNESNAEIFLKLLRLFGMLSENHRKDVLSIIDVILKQG